jgi:hypothetical protein
MKFYPVLFFREIILMEKMDYKLILYFESGVPVIFTGEKNFR